MAFEHVGHGLTETLPSASQCSIRPPKKGAEEGDARPRRGWPLRSTGLVPHLAFDAASIAVAEAPQSIERDDVAVSRGSQDGRRIVPPGERPSTGVAAKKGRERPAIESHPRPRGRPAGSLTPQVSLPETCWGARVRVRQSNLSYGPLRVGTQDCRAV
jgi:hypothetical protein